MYSTEASRVKSELTKMQDMYSELKKLFDDAEKEKNVSTVHVCAEIYAMWKF